MLFFLNSCSDAQFEYSSRPCNVIVDNTVFQDATIAAAMNQMSPGVFCLVQKTISGGAQQFSFSTNTDLSSHRLFTAKEERMTLIFGLNNGVIVGFGNLDYPATFYAYDRECPNCFDPDAVPVKSKPLKMDTKGHASCGVCGRIYDMNNHGYIIQGEKGNPLTRFPASTTGPFGVLVVK